MEGRVNMCVRIGVEDLAANALIELLERPENTRFVSYQDMKEYGLVVSRILEREGEEVVLIMTRAYTEEMLGYYSDFFEETTNNGKFGICLKEGKDADDLRRKFQGYLSFNVLIFFISIESVNVLKVDYKLAIECKRLKNLYIFMMK